MGARNFPFAAIELDFARLTFDLQCLLLWWLLESLRLEQLVVLGLVLILAARRSPTAPSSCR